MSNTLYTQLVHLVTIAALAVLVGMGKLDVQTGISGMALLVGIAIPSPFAASEAKAVAVGPIAVPGPQPG